jgi:alpha-D-ribose 1-methylphosphonate 5-triphosphate diphosphatase
MKTLILSNARVVTPEENFWGTVVVQDGLISEVAKGKNYSGGIDLAGQWLIPGIIDIHSDYLEKELHPRPTASFPAPFAMHFMDARAASCGITTLYSAVSFSENASKSRTFQYAIDLCRAIEGASEGLIAKHLIHARLDPNTPEVLKYLDAMKGLKALRMIVYNDDIPAQRQFTMEHVVQMWMRSKGLTESQAYEQVQEYIKEKSGINHRAEIQAAFEGVMPIGSHDDTTAAHVDEAKYFGADLSEMPTTIEAARRAKELGMFVCMGAPNFYRGGSHCGNLSCSDAMDEGLVDILCSDYHFPTMLGAVCKMMNAGVSPSSAINFVTKNPADYLGMANYGRIEEGMAADIVAFENKGSHAAVSHVVTEGKLAYSTGYSAIKIASAEKAGVI